VPSFFVGVAAHGNGFDFSSQVERRVLLGSVNMAADEPKSVSFTACLRELLDPAGLIERLKPGQTRE
jgi:hypothetical protein